MNMNDSQLAAWRSRALEFEHALNEVVIGLAPAIRLLLIGILARGHALLEGNVGVGKTTLLRAAARGLGGHYQRVEGTIDLMPQDLVYHTFIDRDGRPRVDPGPLLMGGSDLAVFFFNEINRARPQVHSLLLRVMAERSVTAFNAEHRLPHLLVFADRNRVEKEETFELPGATRDRFLLELEIAPGADADVHDSLAFDTRFHDTDSLVEVVPHGVLDYRGLTGLAEHIQSRVAAGTDIRRYVEHLRRATHVPAEYGIRLPEVAIDELVVSGASPRGMGMLVRAARAAAWLDGRDYLLPDDFHAIFHSVIGHRLFFTPIYELQRQTLSRAFTAAILRAVSAA